MRLLFVCPFVPWPLVSGGKIRTFHLIREASAHAQIHLRVVREPDANPGAEEALAPWCASLRFFERSRPSRAKRWLLPKLERWFYSADLHAALRSDLRQGEFQLVHLDELLLARVVPPRRGVPVVQHHHKLDTVLYRELGVAEGPTRHFDLWKLRRLEAESTRRYRHHLLCSQDDAAVLRDRYGALDVAVVPSGFDPEHFRPSPSPRRDPDRLVFLGSMDYGPNVDAVRHFCRAILPEIVRRRPGTVLEIVGRDPAPQVRALASEHVRVVGRVADVRPHLESAALLVVPLRIGGGTRLKIVEALAVRTPVVSTAIGAAGLGLVAGEHVAIADDDDAFARQTTRLLDEPLERDRLAEAGSAFVHERYRWSALAEDLVDYWERVAFSGTVSASR